MRRKWLLFILAIVGCGLALHAALPPQGHMPPTRQYSGGVTNKP